MKEHIRHMRHAINLARRHKGRTGANPSVGCIIVKDGVIIGRGVTAIGGRPHAEMQALNMAGAKAKGATVYVSLEPCAHEGQTPSCARLLTESGIATLVTAMSDPDPRTKGHGHQIVDDAGIKLVTDVLGKEARSAMNGFLSCYENKRPFYQLKMGVSKDWKIAEKRGYPSIVTGDEARSYAMYLRAQCDGILIGIGTAMSDDPQLSVRINGLEDASPIRIILDPLGELSLNSRLAQSARDIPVILAVDQNNLSKLEQKFEGSGLELIGCKVANDLIDLENLSLLLTDRKIGQIMIEGGARTAANFFKSGLVDEIALFRSDKSFGPGALDAIEGKKLSGIIKKYSQSETFSLGADRFTLYQKTPQGE